MLSCGHTASAVSCSTAVQNCELCDRRQIPTTARAERRTPTFSAATTPPGLLRTHHTTTWARLIVTEGFVLFREHEPPWSDTATPGHDVAIVPNRSHHIEPSADAIFSVQFYTLPPQTAIAD